MHGILFAAVPLWVTSWLTPLWLMGVGALAALAPFLLPYRGLLASARGSLAREREFPPERDVSGEELAPDHQGAFRPAVFLYDNHPGGIGLSQPLFERQALIVSDALAMVERCDCSYGCPSCVGPVLASDEARGYSPKALAITVLALLTDSPSGSGAAS